MAFSLDDKNVKTLLMVIVVGLVLYLLVSYMHDSKRPHAHIFGDEPNDHNNTVVRNTNNAGNNQGEGEAEVVSNFQNMENFENAVAPANNAPANNAPVNNAPVNNAPANNAPVNNNVNEVNVEPSEQLGQNEEYNSVPARNVDGANVPSECYPKDVLSSVDLLPQGADSKFAQANPNGQGSLNDKNFLNAGFHIGVNTVGQSLRNANRQLRSEPPNPQVKVSPWLQTTIEPDLNRRPLEIA